MFSLEHLFGQCHDGIAIIILFSVVDVISGFHLFHAATVAIVIISMLTERHRAGWWWNEDEDESRERPWPRGQISLPITFFLHTHSTRHANEHLLHPIHQPSTDGVRHRARILWIPAFHLVSIDCFLSVCDQIPSTFFYSNSIVYSNKCQVSPHHHPHPLLFANQTWSASVTGHHWLIFRNFTAQRVCFTCQL